MNKKTSVLTKICVIAYCILLTLFLTRILVFSDLKDFLRSGRNGLSVDFSEGWMLDSGEEVDINNISAGKLGGELKISKALPDTMEETDSIYFSTSNLNFRVYVDGDLIYSYNTRENMTGTGDGVSYHMIGLGIKDEGKTVVIDGKAAFNDGHGGRINIIQYGAEEQFRYYVMKSNMVGLALSVLMVVFGVVVIAFYFGMSRNNTIMRPLWGLGLSAILFGIWSLCDTGVPQLLTGTIYTTREIVYGILHFASFPIIYFIYCITKTKRKTFLYISFLASSFCFGYLLIWRYVFGADFHNMVGVLYCSYATELLIMVVMLVDNEIVCRKNKVKSNLMFFYLGAGVFVATCFIDMFRYLFSSMKGSIGHGSWFRFGLIIFFMFMALQIFHWWAHEKSSLERDRFINRLLQNVMDSDNPETKINKSLEYLCEELHADRAYIFEDMKDGTFDNTYEYCAKDVTPEIDNLKGLPYDGVIDVWYNEYKKGGHILIYDIEKYREVSENMYNVLKPQGIQTLVTGPLILDGEYIGFFGVDNPPAEMMLEISEIIRLLMFFLSEMVGQRDTHNLLLKYSFQDPMTGAGNRRAIREFETDELDTSKPYGFIMCDINGLKAVNDSEGHDAGDQMIKTVATSLMEVFGKKNVYRMGGDEFAVYTYQDTLQEFEEAVERIKAVISQKGIQAAIGYSYAAGGDPDYNKHRIDADNRMYEEKRKFYSEGHDRRKAHND